ncbi:MAG: hypothetical protein WDO71_18500 [Bacteroidota bacterium]
MVAPIVCGHGPLRRLGPGSTIKEFDGTSGTPDRYGDVQLEANAEFRFPLFKAAGIPVNGAIFTDIGNVWLLEKGSRYTGTSF